MDGWGRRDRDRARIARIYFFEGRVFLNILFINIFIHKNLFIRILNIQESINKYIFHEYIYKESKLLRTYKKKYS